MTPRSPAARLVLEAFCFVTVLTTDLTTDPFPFLTTFLTTFLRGRTMSPHSTTSDRFFDAGVDDGTDASNQGNGGGTAVAEPCDAFGRSAIHDPRGDVTRSSAAVEPRNENGAAHWADLDWPSVIWIGGVHLAALLAPFYFTWSGLAICLALYWVTGGLGVCLGYHRLLTHGSFQTTKPMRFLFALLGGVSGEGSAIDWVANHRKHHAFSDQDGDPHTPRDGGLWAHIFWIFPKHTRVELAAHTKRWAPDLVKDKGVVFLHKTFLVWHILLGSALLAAGWTFFDRFTGVSWLVWGLAVRMVIVFHITWLVNSASHMWGYRNYETTDDSRNLWWVGLLAFGEGWHNNHHAYQRMAAHGHRWWELDPTYWVIRGLESVGLAWDVVHTRHGISRKPPLQAAANRA